MHAGQDFDGVEPLDFKDFWSDIFSDDANFDLDESDVWDDLPHAEESSNDDKISGISIDMSGSFLSAGSKVHAESENAGEDAVYQYINLIFLRLVDDLELIFLCSKSEVYVDLSKQLHRLANLVCFLDKGEYLPLIAYADNILPLTFTESPPGEFRDLYVDASKFQRLSESVPELFACLAYLIDAFRDTNSESSRNRFSSSLCAVAEKMNVDVGKPSSAAPLPVAPSGMGPRSDLTSRTLDKIVLNVETLLLEATESIVATTEYGFSKGYSNASNSFFCMSRIFSEFRFDNLSQSAYDCCLNYENRPPHHRPEKHELKQLENFLRAMHADFPEISVAMHVRQLQKVENAHEISSGNYLSFNASECVANFFSAYDGNNFVEALQSTAALHEETKEIDEIFRLLIALASRYPEFCRKSLLVLLTTLFRHPDAEVKRRCAESFAAQLRKISAGVMPQSADLFERFENFSAEFQKHLEDPRKLSPETLIALLCDANFCDIHALRRMTGILFELVASACFYTEGLKVPDEIVEADFLIFELGNLLLEHYNAYGLGQEPHKARLFYESLAALFQVSEQPGPALLLHIHNLLDNARIALQNMWGETAAPVDGAYYAEQLNALASIASHIGIVEANTLIEEHLANVPVNITVSGNRLNLQRQLKNIFLKFKSALLDAPIPRNNPNIKDFFSAFVPALNAMLETENDAVPTSLILDVRATLFEITEGSHCAVCQMLLHEFDELLFDPSVEKIENVLFAAVRSACAIVPEWQPAANACCDDLPLTIPLAEYRQQSRIIEELYNLVKDKAEQFPLIWERIYDLYHLSRPILSDLHEQLNRITSLVKQRLRFSKKNVSVRHTVFDANAVVLPNPELDAFLYLMQSLGETIANFSFVTPKADSSVMFNLACYENELSASVRHNGNSLTENEILRLLAKINVVPAKDDDILELVCQNFRLYKVYPPLSSVAALLRLAKRFNVTIKLKSYNAFSYFDMHMPLSSAV